MDPTAKWRLSEPGQGLLHISHGAIVNGLVRCRKGMYFPQVMSKGKPWALGYD